MAQIDKPNLHFNTKLYTGNGGTNAITGVGFQPDMVWIKARSYNDDHTITDAVRGNTKVVYPNNTNAEATSSSRITAFGTDGFTLGASGDVNSNTATYVNWSWKAGTTGSGTTTGTGTGKAYSYSVNTTAGISIVKYLGNGNAGQQIPHHLGAVPKMILLKPLDAADNWRVYHVGIDDTSPGDYHLQLQGTGVRVDNVDVWNDTIPTSTYFTLGSNSGVVANDQEFIAYCYAEKKGYSKFGRYFGNSNANGTFVYTGFRPAFIMIKGAVSGDGDAAQSWEIYDSKREGYNLDNDAISANNNGSEGTGDRIIMLSNGFKTIINSDGVNDNNSRYIYMAFAENPIVGSNNIPAVAR